MADKYFKGSFSQLYGYGYYAFVDNDGRLVIGEERGREGGELYRGEYKGEKTPWLSDIKKENVRLYNSIVKYFNEHTNKDAVVIGQTVENKKRLAKLICEATQKTSYKCNDACKALCDCNGCCAYCLTIAEHLMENKVVVSAT